MPDFSMFAGDTKILEIGVVDELGAPVDIAGTAIRWQLARKVKDPPIISKALGSGIVIVDGPAGRFNVQLDPADTLELSGSHYFEAEIVDGSVVSTVLTGTADIKPALIDPP